MQQKTTCLICAAPLSPARAQHHQLCWRGECHFRHSLLRQRQQLCRICGRPLTTQESNHQLCSDVECQRSAGAERAHQVEAQNQARDAELAQQERRQAADLRHRLLDTFGIQPAAAFPLVVIPSYTASIVRLSARRRRAFRNHLTMLVAGLAGSPDAPPIAEAPVLPPSPSAHAQALLGQACACCRGFCCRGGGDHAYLKVETFRRYLATHPELDAADLPAVYLDAVGSRTYENSCLYHQADGCALPRDLRAAICNRYFCAALMEFQRNLPDHTGPLGGCFATAHRGVVHTITLVKDTARLTLHGSVGG